MTDGPADRAWRLLADGLTPQDIVACLTPTTRDEAVRAARRLPLLHERPVADRGAALARLAALTGMRAFRLTLAADGRVLDDRHPRRHDPGSAVTFPCAGGTVTYTLRSTPDKDHFQFLGMPEPGPWETPPRAPLPLSPTGHWSHFADPDAVAALGGPEEYVAALQAAGRAGANAFIDGLTGAVPARSARPGRPPRPVVGGHTARVMPPTKPTASVPETAEPDVPRPGRLF